MREVAHDPKVAGLFERLQRITVRLASLSRNIPNAKRLNEIWLRRLAEVRAAKESLEAELSRESATFEDVNTVVTREKLLAALPDDCVLVDYVEYNRSLPSHRILWEGTRSLLAFVVHKNQPVQMIDLGPVAPLGEAIDTWRVSFGMSPEAKEAGRTLREKLWEPLLPALEGAKTILVSPDGALGRLPLGALPGKQPGSYLIEDYRLTLVPVPQLIPALMREAGGKKLPRQLLLMGGIDYDHRSEPSSGSTPTRPARAFLASR